MFRWKEITINPNTYNDFESGISYPCCNTLYCLNCNSIFMDIRPSIELVKRYYFDYQSENFHQERETIEKSYANRRKSMDVDDFAGYCSYLPKIEDFIQRFSKSSLNRILDIGGGDGSGTPFSKFCNDLHIYDINSKITDNSNCNIIFHNKMPYLEMQKGFDLVICRNVLEHLSNPYLYIKKIVSNLRSDTLFYFEVPFEHIMRNGFDSSTLKIWTEHINFFTPIAIKYLMERNSIRIIHSDILSTGKSMAGYDHDFQVIRFIGSLKK